MTGLWTSRRRRHAAPPPRRRQILARSLVVCLVLGAAFTSIGSASAAVVRIAGIAHPSTYVGVESVHGAIGVCTGNGGASPTVLTPGTRIYAPTSAWALNSVTSADGSNLDRVWGAAVATVVKNDPAVPNNHRGPTPDVGVGAQVAQIRSAAAAYGGARSVPLSLSSTSTPPGLTWQVSGVGIQAPGGWMPGRTMTLQARGPAVFEASGTDTVTVTTTTAPQTLALRSTGNGPFTVAAETTVPSNYVIAHPEQGAGYQRITTRVGDEPLSGETGAELAVVDFRPSAVTQTTVVTASGPGVEVRDRITITGARPHSTLTGRSTLYGPLSVQPVEEAEAPAGTPVVGTAEYEVTTDQDGSATVETTALTLPEAGYYVWQEEIDGDPDDVPSPRNLGFRGPYGVGSETSLVAPPPDVRTQVSRQQVLVGQPVSDTVTIDGTLYGRDGLGPIGTVLTGRLYGPLDPVDPLGTTCDGLDWTNAPIAHEFGPITVTSEQQELVGVGEFVPTVRGCYSYGETLVATNSQGEEIFRVEHEGGRTEQTTLAQEPQAVTQINATVVAPGETFSDTVSISGTAGTSGTFEAVLWGPVAPDPVDACWIGTERWRELIAGGEAQARHSETLAFSGDGDVVTSDVPVTELGCYTWSALFDFDGAPGTGLESPPGLETETGLVAAPAIQTVAQATTTTLGGEFSDVITVTGTQGLPGTVTARIMTAPPVSGACTDVDWEADGTEIGTITPIAMTGDGTVTSDATVIDGVGAVCATFAATWTPGHELLVDAAVADPPGLVAETILFTPDTPTVSAGEPSVAGVPVWLLAGVVLTLGGAGTTVWQVRRRRAEG